MGGPDNMSKMPRFAWLRLLKLGSRSGKHHAPPGRGAMARMAEVLLPLRDLFFSMDLYVSIDMFGSSFYLEHAAPLDLHHALLLHACRATLQA